MSKQESLWQKIKTLVFKMKQLIVYGSISVFVTVIDVAICFLLEQFIPYIWANAVGVVTGFILEYIIASKKVWDSQNVRTFVVYIITFLIGLSLAQGIVWFSRSILFGGADGMWAFLVSKGLSIVIPFFVMFGLRKLFIQEGEKRA